MEKITFTSAKNKADAFKKELNELLHKFDAELEIDDFGRDGDGKIVASFEWDKSLSDSVGSGFLPDWVIGTRIKAEPF